MPLACQMGPFNLFNGESGAPTLLHWCRDLFLGRKATEVHRGHHNTNTLHDDDGDG